MANDFINGSLQKRYPKVVFTSVVVLDDRAFVNLGKGDTALHQPGDKYYVQPTLKGGKRAVVYPNLPTPFIDVIRVIKDESQNTDKTAIVVKATDLSEPLVGRISEWIGWPSAINELYRQYLMEDNVDKLIGRCREIMADHIGKVDAWQDRDNTYYYVDEKLLSKYSGVSKLDSTEFYSCKKNDADDEFPRSVFMPSYNNFVLSVTSGATTLTYRAFVYLNARGFPMFELLRVRNDDVNRIWTDKNDFPVAVTLSKLYSEFFKSKYFDMVAQYMHHEKRSPVMIVNESVVDDPSIMDEVNVWGVGYEYLDSLSGADSPSASAALKYIEEHPEQEATTSLASSVQIIEQIIDTQSGEVVSEVTLTPEEIQKRADAQKLTEVLVEETGDGT